MSSKYSQSLLTVPALLTSGKTKHCVPPAQAVVDSGRLDLVRDANVNSVLVVDASMKAICRQSNIGNVIVTA